ncbi:ATP5O.2 family protein [Megaselia abdita]
MSALRNLTTLSRFLPMRTTVHRAFACPRVVQNVFNPRMRTFSSGSNTIADLEEELAALQLSDDVNYNPIVVMNAIKEKEEEEEVMCEVILAKELDNAQRRKLEDVLMKFLKPEEKLKLNLRIDPKIVGGMIVSVGDKYFDLSIATKVEKLGEKCEK